MKRLIPILLAVLIVMSFTACSTSKTVPTPSTQTTPSMQTTPSPQTTLPSSTAIPSVGVGQYKDGTYEAQGDPWEFGMEDAKVVVKDAKITDITLRRLNKDGTEIDYKMFDGKTHDGKMYPNLKEDRMTLAKKMIEKQGTDVDTIAGATVSTKNWKIAAQRALDKAK